MVETSQGRRAGWAKKGLRKRIGGGKSCEVLQEEDFGGQWRSKHALEGARVLFFLGNERKEEHKIIQKQGFKLPLVVRDRPTPPSCRISNGNGRNLLERWSRVGFARNSYGFFL